MTTEMVKEENKGTTRLKPSSSFRKRMAEVGYPERLFAIYGLELFGEEGLVG